MIVRDGRNQLHDLGPLRAFTLPRRFLAGSIARPLAEPEPPAPTEAARESQRRAQKAWRLSHYAHARAMERERERRYRERKRNERIAQ